MRKNGRISLTELAEKVGISLSPVQRRVKALEENGTILGYRTDIDNAHLGLNFSVMLFVNLKETTQDNILAFENALATIDEIVEAVRLFGDPDCLVKILTQDLASYQKLYDTQLSSLPNVQKITSTLVMKDIQLNNIN